MGYLELNVLQPGPPQAALGIDLGTTNSLAAIWKDGRPEILRPDGESGLIPSVIHFPADGPPIVGREARARAVADPRNTIFSVKRFMGRGLSDVKEDLASLPYRASETDHKVIQIDVAGTSTRRRSSPPSSWRRSATTHGARWARTSPAP
jgi:molecular chaperone DnaK (HSP70)